MNGPDREELEALAAIFGESNRMDGMWAEKPVGSNDSNVIRSEIEKLARSNSQQRAQQSVPVTNQEIPPAMAPQIQPLTQEEIQLLQQGQATPPPANPNPNEQQLEFNFSRKEQEVTNELLENISKKLTKLISILSSKDVSDKENKNKQSEIL